MTSSLQYINQTVAHQLRTAIERIEEGSGVVSDFNYDEDFEYTVEPSFEKPVPEGSRTVTIELEMLLPE